MKKEVMNKEVKNKPVNEVKNVKDDKKKILTCRMCGSPRRLSLFLYILR